MKRFFTVFVLFLAVLHGLFSQEPVLEGRNENIITAISVSGLKRTKPHIIETPLQKFIGRDADSIDINEVIAILKSAAIVEPLTVEIKDNQDGTGALLAITVQEKWSILPLPFFSINSTGWGVGGALMDTNAFGVQDTIMLMGNYSTDGWMAGGMYINSPKSVGDFGWNIMGMFVFQDKENTDQKDERVVRRFNSLSINPSVGLSYRPTELVTSNINIAYRGVMLRDTESPINAPENNVHGISLSPAISIAHNTWDGYFLNEKSASLKYQYAFVIEGDDVHSVSLNAALNHSIIPGFRLTGKTGILYSTPSASPFFESSPSAAAVNILPQKYSAIQYAGVSLGLETYLFKLSFGTVAVSAAYQAVYSDGESLHHQFDHGAVAMLQLYFSKIAVPGMGLGAAYNVDKNTWQYAFNIGMML